MFRENIRHYSPSTPSVFTSRHWQWGVVKKKITESQFEISLTTFRLLYPVGPLIGKYCGTKTPSNLRSSTGILSLTFHTDMAVAKDGFSARYYLVHQEPPESELTIWEFLSCLLIRDMCRYRKRADLFEDSLTGMLKTLWCYLSLRNAMFSFPLGKRTIFNWVLTTL